MSVEKEVLYCCKDACSCFSIHGLILSTSNSCWRAALTKSSPSTLISAESIPHQIIFLCAPELGVVLHTEAELWQVCSLCFSKRNSLFSVIYPKHTPKLAVLTTTRWSKTLCLTLSGSCKDINAIHSLAIVFAKMALKMGTAFIMIVFLLSIRNILWLYICPISQSEDKAADGFSRLL